MTKRGFTLVELLVVMAIIGILVGMLLPAVQMIREAARRTKCLNQSRQIVLALHNFEAANQEFPMGSPGGQKHAMWTRLLPYLEQENVYDRCEFDGNAWDDPMVFTLIDTYICPAYPVEVFRNGSGSFQEGALLTYQGVAGVVAGTASPEDFGEIPENGMFGFEFEREGRDIVDGTSNTLVIGEFVQADRGHDGRTGAPPGNVRPWVRGGFSRHILRGASYAFKVIEHPPNARVNRGSDGVPFNHLPMGSFHPGVTVFSFADGSVHNISDNVDFDVYQSLATVDGRESVSYTE